MPTSTWRQIGAVMEHVEDAYLAAPGPFRVLDVGCGWGRYGALIHDTWPGSYIVGIDAVPEQVRWREAYDYIAEGQLPRLGESWGRFDVVLFLDVIEHLTRDDGYEALAWCRRRGTTIVATPNGPYEQEGGRWETHRSAWAVEDLWGYGATDVRTVLPRERPPAPMGAGQLVARFEASE